MCLESDRRTLVPAEPRRLDPGTTQASPTARSGQMSSAATTAAAWGADFFGTLNELPSEPVDAIAQVLEAMRTEPAFQGARKSMLADLQVGPGGLVVDAGCGTGAALPDILEVVG